MSEKGETKSDNSTENKQEDQDGGKDIKTRFDEYATFQDPKSDGRIHLKNLEMWLRQAELLDEKDGVSEAEIVKAFEKTSERNMRMNYKEFEEFIEVMAKIMKMNVEELAKKLSATEQPGTDNFTPPIRGPHHFEMLKNQNNEELDDVSANKYVSVFKYHKGDKK